MRANLFCYCTMDDPWLREFRHTPQQALFAAMPGLRRQMGDFEASGRIQIRPVDLYVTEGIRKPGLVLIGDAFATSCPAAGTGARKALNDAERLGNVHIPHWLATPGMGVDKIANFYEDPVKQACDEFSLAKAYDLRSLTVDPGPSWAARRWLKFGGQLARGSRVKPAPGWPRGCRSGTPPWQPVKPGASTPVHLPLPARPADTGLMGAKHFGARVKRLEDPALLVGRGRFVDDIPLPGTLHACFVRSPHSHARVRSIDASAALAQPGVHAVLTAADLPGPMQELTDPDDPAGCRQSHNAHATLPRAR